MTASPGRLPPLGSLRAFEAAARHLSFTRAADELHVTQAAISHQIRQLEEDLGVRLFQRLNRALRLTDDGALLLPYVRNGFASLVEGVGRLRSTNRSGFLSVTAPPSIAASWLIPRLERFRAVHPEIEVRLLSGTRLVDFAREDIDVGIRYGRGLWPGLHLEQLMSDDLFPVCGPAMAARLKAPADLQAMQLLHVLNFPDDWQRWLAAAAVTGVDPRRGSWFETAVAAYDAAVQGLGVAIGRRRLVTTLVAEGRLVVPFDVELSAAVGYYFVCPPDHLRLGKVAVFRDWLFAEAASTEAGADGNR